MFVGVVVQFSQEEYMAAESAGYAKLKVIISGRHDRPISIKYKVFVSSAEFQPNPGLYSVIMHMIIQVHFYMPVVAYKQFCTNTHMKITIIVNIYICDAFIVIHSKQC